jgi:hypothetical protein
MQLPIMQGCKKGSWENMGRAPANACHMLAFILSGCTAENGTMDSVDTCEPAL